MVDEWQLEQLEKVYQQQHYFIDRHDAMAEKFINVLLVEVTCFSFLFTARVGVSTGSGLHSCAVASILVFLGLFVLSLLHLFLIVRPLSRKAAKLRDESLVKRENKYWITKSSLYYKGIIEQYNDALQDNKVPFEAYCENLTSDSIAQDYYQQIVILARYSQYKHNQLNLGLYLVCATTAMGLISSVSLMLH